MNTDADAIVINTNGTEILPSNWPPTWLDSVEVRHEKHVTTYDCTWGDRTLQVQVRGNIAKRLTSRSYERMGALLAEAFRRARHTKALECNPYGWDDQTLSCIEAMTSRPEYDADTLRANLRCLKDGYDISLSAEQEDWIIEAVQGYRRETAGLPS